MEQNLQHTEHEAADRREARDSCEPTRGGKLHRGAASWCDTCCCEPEPRWRDLGERLGMDVDG